MKSEQDKNILSPEQVPNLGDLEGAGAVEALQRSEERARRQRAAFAALAHDDAVVAGEPTALQRISATLCETIGVARGSIWTLCSDGKELQCLSLYEMGKNKHNEKMVLQSSSIPHYLKTLLTERRIDAEDAQNDPRTSELKEHYLIPLGITSMLDAAIVIEGKLSGAVCLEHTGNTRRWHPDEEAFAYIAATIAAQVFINAQRKQREEAFRQSEGKFRYIAEFSPLPLAIINERGNYEYINQQFREVFGYTLEDLSTGKKWFSSAYPDQLYRRKIIDTWLNDLQKLGRNVVRSRVFKVTCKDGSEKDIHFRPVLMENGKQLVISEDITERLKMEKDVQARNRELTTLYNLSTHMRAARSSADLLPIILEETRRLLQADDGMIVLHEPQRSCFTISVGAGHWKGSSGQSLPLDRAGCLSIVFNSGKPYVSSNYSVDAHALPLDYGEQTGPAVFVPFQSQDTVMGIMMLARCRGVQARPFSPAEVHLLNVIGEMAGNALHRQQLHERAQQRMEQLQALRKIDMAITSNQDICTTLQITLCQVTEMLQVDGAAILRITSGKARKYLAWHGFRNIDAEKIKYYPGVTGMDSNTLPHIWRRVVAERCSIFIPDLLKTGHDFKQHALMTGEGFVTYGAIPLIARNEVQGVLELFHREPFYPDDDCLKFMETIAGQAAIAIDNDQLFTSLEQANVELTLAYDATIEGWAYALDLRDEETEGHSQRVAELTVILALAMGIPEDQLLHIRRGALLHDIGKMGIPDAILLKPDKLTEEEWEIMRRHPQYALEMLQPIEYLRPALQIPCCHHEKWDGSGYPRGLKGEAIPLEARIFAVVDVYDALISHRPYRPAWPREKALELIRNERGRHFEPRIVDLFLDLMKENREG